MRLQILTIGVKKQMYSKILMALSSSLMIKEKRQEITLKKEQGLQELDLREQQGQNRPLI